MEKNIPQKQNITVELNGKRGYVTSKELGVMTFNIEGVSDRENMRVNDFRSLYSMHSRENNCLQVQNFWVPLWGEGHNLYPQEVDALISEHKMLPSIIEKQVKFLFGKGPRLYIEQIQGEGENQKRVRVPYSDPAIEAWLNAWEEKGYPHHWEYLKCLADDYYRVKTCCTQYHLNRGRRLSPAGAIDALSYVGSDEARLAADGNFYNKRVKSDDCRFVMVGDWLNLGMTFQVFPRFSPKAPTANPEAIAFNTDKTFGKWVYAYNEWFKGLKEWIKSGNLTPKYLNSYLKNALNAHVHVTIPGTWYQAHKNMLQDICTNNIVGDENTPVQKEYKGVMLVDDKGKPYRFFEAMMNDLISAELKKITELMTGEGENQGKMYATLKYGEEGWKFEEFPSKFKEYFEAVISLDKRADQMILAGKGISSSITNVENDGVISKSGSDVYYNYLIYVGSLTMDEYFITKEITRAIQINFPYAKAKGIKLGFWIDIPAKQDETSAANRLQNTATPNKNSNTAN